MRLEQLRFLCEVHDRGFSISKAAEALHISQPAVSTQIRLLEEELGAEILLRRNGRIVGLTPSGSAILNIARRITTEVENLRNAPAEFANETIGRFCIATTHINARYVLIGVLQRFRRKYPDVRLVIRQGDPSAIRDFVASGEADLGITSAPVDGLGELKNTPCYVLERSVVVPAGHPLLKRKSLSLRHIASYPIITMDASFAGGGAVLRAFARKGIEPNVVMTATDAAVIKAYVALGMGITILPKVAFDPQVDKHLRLIEAAHLFEPTTTFVCVHPRVHLRHFMHDFTSMLLQK